ncbi:28S ribosomal protein S22-like protein [Dinothrombium tinctorium]|uniref:28S ribosomal protein S22-like protein n=1 Tax=Dinothrombium tinctorium TaxID=1965070 RepID=A0A3S3S5Z4_9ACAR|nr:28S ribosomal protein S22-like protein [Dinothrombium tinctorium]RWS03380.1 28S ribosomal protein S22-like protein [Dinothrombium tinctorium]RWS10855.1 28S ribosomal protein S22-like protein [Dinothrombium tinctorium]
MFRKVVKNWLKTGSNLRFKCERFSNDARDVEKLFLRKDVQRILEEITGFDLNRVFSQKPVPRLNAPRYLFLTDEDLKMSMERAKRKAKHKLAMPPIMNPREDVTQILEVDTALQGFDKHKYIFTDISLGFNDRNRLIVVREPNGVLRRANRQERYHMNQTFFPAEGRSMEVPKMFEDEYLQEVLDRQEYLFALERTCVQFEPDDPQHIQIMHKIYDHINDSKKFELLRSTRHFGPMAFYLAFNDKIDNLLIDMIDRRRISDGSNLVKLYYITNQREDAALHEEDDLQIIKSYVMKDSKHRHYLEVSLQNYQHYIEELKAMEENIELADGKKARAGKD